MAYAARTSIRASRRQKDEEGRIEGVKVEAQAFERARRIYDDAIQKLEREIEYLNVQVDRIREQLTSEQNVSDTLRTRIRELEEHFQSRSDPLAELRNPSNGPLFGKHNT